VGEVGPAAPGGPDHRHREGIEHQEPAAQEETAAGADRHARERLQRPVLVQGRPAGHGVGVAVARRHRSAPAQGKLPAEQSRRTRPPQTDGRRPGPPPHNLDAPRGEHQTRHPSPEGERLRAGVSAAEVAARRAPQAHPQTDLAVDHPPRHGVAEGGGPGRVRAEPARRGSARRADGFRDEVHGGAVGVAVVDPAGENSLEEAPEDALQRAARQGDHTGEEGGGVDHGVHSADAVVQVEGADRTILLCRVKMMCCRWPRSLSFL
jgi:hypothetical protein